MVSKMSNKKKCVDNDECCIDFACDCGDKQCGKVRFCLSEDILDVGFLKSKEKRPKIGIVIRGENYKKLIKFLKNNS